MRIGLIDVDGHNFPNLALMKISAYHKAKGDTVEWCIPLCLVNYNSTMDENLYRIYTLRDLGYDPYVMVYDKPHAPLEIKKLQRWCNNRWVFAKCRDFKDYDASKKNPKKELFE